jgi:phage tail protein X
MTTRTLTFPNSTTPLDLLLFTTYRREVSGFVEATLAANPGLAALGPYPPLGTKITVTDPAPQASANSTPLVTLYD